MGICILAAAIFVVYVLAAAGLQSPYLTLAVGPLILLFYNFIAS